MQFRYIHIEFQNNYDQDGTEIMGMCLLDSCSEDLGRGTTYFADIFAAQAPLTDEQMLAEQAMLAMATEEF